MFIYTDHFQMFIHKSVSTINTLPVGPQPPEHGGLYTGRSKDLRPQLLRSSTSK